MLDCTVSEGVSLPQNIFTVFELSVKLLQKLVFHLVHPNNPKEIVTEKHFQFEQVWAKATIAGQVHIFASVYFPPDHANKQSYELFFKTVEIITSKMEPEVKLHIYGDFNQSKVEFISDQENEAILLPVIGENETLHFLFDNIANYGLFQINH
uniref:(northern house mosquito) hypothetical protein n=1 Tax=Culex pipiens TaxID=7175 RepID=A0A8D8FQ40_CULPI